MTKSVLSLHSWSTFTSRITSLFFFFSSSCKSGIIPLEQEAVDFLKSLQSKADSFGSFFLHLKWRQEKQSLWKAILAVSNHTSDKIANLTCSFYTSTDLLPFSRRRPSATSDVISIFIFVTWAQCKWIPQKTACTWSQSKSRTAYSRQILLLRKGVMGTIWRPDAQQFVNTISVI